MNYLLVGTILMAGMLVIFFIQSKRNKRNPPRNRVDTTKDSKIKSPSEDEFIDDLVAVPARVYDNRTRRIYNRMLPASDVRQIRRDFGNLGRMWYWNNEWRYAVVRLVDGTCRPVQNYMTRSLDNPPEKLHRALQQEETEALFSPRDNRGVLTKYGAYLLFAGVVIGILFIWGANIMR